MNFSNVEFEKSAYNIDQLDVSDLPEVVFSGRSNVGKSSMINKLVNRKALARVSSAPGKTASINFYRIGEFRLVDLPGYGFARVSKAEKRKWSELVEGYFSQQRRIALVIQLIDMRHEPTRDDMDMIAFLRQTGCPFIIAATKSDKLNKTQFEQRKNSIPAETGINGSGQIILFSAQNGMGVDELNRAISESLECQNNKP